jgi:hypothetical protein
LSSVVFFSNPQSHTGHFDKRRFGALRCTWWAKRASRTVPRNTIGDGIER